MTRVSRCAGHLGEFVGVELYQLFDEVFDSRHATRPHENWEVFNGLYVTEDDAAWRDKSRIPRQASGSRLVVSGLGHGTLWGWRRTRVDPKSSFGQIKARPRVRSRDETVRLLTSAQARILGFGDRGRLAVGMRADINVIGIDVVVEGQPKLVNDFPGGVPRLIEKAQGYRATICNGSVIVSEGEFTGARAGQVLRNNAA